MKRILNSFIYIRGMRAYSLREYDRAEKILKRLGPPFNKNKKYLCVMGNISFLLGMNSDAIKYLEESLESGWNPKDQIYLDLWAKNKIQLIRGCVLSRETIDEMRKVYQNTRRTTRNFLPPPFVV